jgi:hypothetical protein
VRRFAAVALAAAMADVATEDAANRRHQRQFSGFSNASSWAGLALLACGLGLAGSIGMVATALATL